MDNVNQLMDLVLRPGTFILSLAVVISTFFIKRIVEIVQPTWRASKGMSGATEGKEVVRTTKYSNKMALWWNEVILYAIPIVSGMILGYVDSPFLHGEANEHLGTRLMWAAGVSWLASFFYKIFRKMVLQKTGVDIQPGPISLPPPGAGV
jgi:hypothetical protein